MRKRAVQKQGEEDSLSADRAAVRETFGICCADAYWLVHATYADILPTAQSVLAALRVEVEASPDSGN